MMNAVDEEEAVMNKPIAPHLEKHKTGAGNYVKSIIYGGSDGIVSVFVTVAAVSGSNFGIGLVLVLGLAKLFAGALSMGVGDWLATDAEVDMASKERQREEWECENYLEGEVEEMVELYVKKGLDENTAREIMNILSKNKKVFVDIMMAEELGIAPDIVDESPWKHGLINFTIPTLTQMISRFSSLKSLKNIQTILLPKVSNKSAHPVPKTYIASTLDELSPKRATMHHLHKSAENLSFSGSQFVKETKEKAKELLHEFAHMVVHGSKSAYKDAKYLYSVTSSKSKNDYTVQEIREVKRITVDLIKFVPFYAAVIIPAGEIALLPYLYLFPRAVPSYFLADKAIKENKDKAMDKQFAAHQHLKQHLLDVMAQAGYDVSVRDPESMRQFFIQNQDKLMPLLETRNMNSEMLKHASDFLMFEYVEGTYILNTLYKTTVNLPKYGVNMAMWIARNSYRAAWNHPVFEYNFKLNSFPFEGMKKQFLKYQFEKQLKSLNAQGDAMMSGLFGNLPEESVMDVAKERGFYANNAESAKKWLEENWNQTKQAQTNMSAFWYSVVQYESL